MVASLQDQSGALTSGPRTLLSKFLLIVLLADLLIGVVLTSYLSGSIRDRLDRELILQMRSLALSTSTALGEPLWAANETTIGEILNSMGKFQQVTCVALVDNEKKMRMGWPEPDCALRSSNPRVGQDIEWGGRNFAHLEVLYSRHHVEETISENVAQMNFVLGALLMATILLAAWAHRLIIGRPLARLLTSIRLGGGVDWRSHDELGQVITAYNKMIEEIAHRTRDLEIAREQAEAARSEAEDARSRAENASRAKSDFLAVMSHEIRSPLHGMSGLINMAKRNSNEPEVIGNLREALQNCDELTILLNDILDYSKIEAGSIEFASEPFDLKMIVQGVQQLMWVRIEEKGLDFEARIDDAVPRFLVGDMHRLQQILKNLIGNAVKFTERGAVTLAITLLEQQGGKAVQLRFEVRDTGIGIAADILPQLFNSFVQADSSIARRFGGSGLGLAICRRLVTGQGGVIDVESQLGVGTRFWFTLPFGIADAEQVGMAQVAKERSGNLPVQVKPMRVLLAEDSAVNQKIVLAFLKPRGHLIDVAVNGRIAVEMASQTSYDIVLMDMNMPEMDGLEATRQIRKLTGAISRVPIVALTAAATRENTQDCRRAGMDDVMHKPFDVDKMVQLVESFGQMMPEAPPSQQPAHPVPQPLIMLNTPRTTNGGRPFAISRTVPFPAPSRDVPPPAAAVSVAPAPAAGETVPVLDGPVFERLVAQLGIISIAELIADFKETGRRSLPVIQDPAASAVARADAAHTLKGAASQFGLLQLAAVLLDVELGFLAQEEEKAASLGGLVEQRLLQAIQQLEQGLADAMLM